MKKILIPVLIIIACVLADMFTKGALIYLITGGVPLAGAAMDMIPYSYMMAHVTDWFNIVFTWNPGTSFSMFRGVGLSAPMVMVLLTGAIIAWMGWYLFARARTWERVPIAIIVGGALGNLIDRVRFGAVVDFLDFHIGGWHWPAFNVGDICICTGVGLYLLMWYIARRKCAQCKGM